MSEPFWTMLISMIYGELNGNYLNHHQFYLIFLLNVFVKEKKWLVKFVGSTLKDLCLCWWYFHLWNCLHISLKNLIKTKTMMDVRNSVTGLSWLRILVKKKNLQNFITLLHVSWLLLNTTLAWCFFSFLENFYATKLFFF